MNDFISNFHFLRPVWLLAIPCAMAIWWVLQRQQDPLVGWRKQMNAELLRALTVGQGTTRNLALSGLFAGWILTTLAVAGLTWKKEPNPFASDARPLIILLKADESMQATGASPSPLERAQLKIADLAQDRQGQPLGLITYAGSAHLVLPPTRDTQVVATLAAEISPEIMPIAGDRLDLAIRRAGQLLKGETEPLSLLVMADAVQHDPQQVVSAYQESGIAAIQFLALGPADSPQTASIRELAKALKGSVQQLTFDDQDIDSIVRFAETQASAGIAGDSRRWQEAGYWLTPLLAILVLLSFRRQRLSTTETQS